MRVSFYEEFPTKENLKKLALVNFPATLIIAAKSWAHFREITRGIKKKNIKFIYWPAIRTTYWISPFSNTEDLVEIFGKLDGKKEDYLFDLEFPMHNKSLILKNFFKFWKHKKMIRNFLLKNKEYALLAVYPLSSGFWNYLLRLVGLDYKIKMKRKPMFYTSYFRGHRISFLINSFYRNLRKVRDKENIILGLGVIAKGKLTFTILQPDELERDLSFAQDAGYKEVIIFRLGGLNKEYMKVIRKFLD